MTLHEIADRLSAGKVLLRMDFADGSVAFVTAAEYCELPIDVIEGAHVRFVNLDQQN